MSESGVSIETPSRSVLRSSTRNDLYPEINMNDASPLAKISVKRKIGPASRIPINDVHKSPVRLSPVKYTEKSAKSGKSIHSVTPRRRLQDALLATRSELRSSSRITASLDRRFTKDRTSLPFATKTVQTEIRPSVSTRGFDNVFDKDTVRSNLLERLKAITANTKLEEAPETPNSTKRSIISPRKSCLKNSTSISASTKTSSTLVTSNKINNESDTSESSNTSISDDTPTYSSNSPDNHPRKKLKSISSKKRKAVTWNKEAEMYIFDPKKTKSSLFSSFDNAPTLAPQTFKEIDPDAPATRLSFEPSTPCSPIISPFRSGVNKTESIDDRIATMMQNQLDMIKMIKDLTEEVSDLKEMLQQTTLKNSKENE